MKRAVCLVVSTAVGLTGLITQPAFAHRSPALCNKNGVVLNVERSQAEVKNGDNIQYFLTVANDASGSCDITNATIDLILPARDGKPTGQRVRVVTGASYPFNYHETRVGTVPYTVALDKGVQNATVRAVFVDGILHDNPADTSLAGIFKDIGSFMTPPTINITKVANPTNGPAPLTVTYTYTVTNTSTLDLPVNNVVVTDNLCSNPTYSSGDTDGDGALDRTEVWIFLCTMVHPNPGTYVNTANVCGDGVLGGEHVCAGPVQATVVVTAPPKPVASASKPDVCLSVPKKLSVRAKELTTVKVTVTDGVIQGASIKLRGPGINRSGKSNSKGQATFKVRPTKKGTLTISSSSCLNAARVSVKAARQTQSRQVPRNTG
jgi:uncharacterized repeat protein (TIGR01451 family)